ncbi:MAG TPA: hypothetical protein VFF73_38560 [Planctomycetota bacterium]|nr:hypothetical protein [Planctomycetota bacterium]
MLDWLFKRGGRGRDALLARFEEAMSRGKLDDAEQALRDGTQAFPNDPIFVVNLAKLVARNDLAQARAMIDSARARPGSGIPVWQTAVELALMAHDPGALALAREATSRVPGDDEVRRIFFLTLARRVYWAGPNAEATEDPDQLALHETASAVTQLGFMGLVDLEGSLWEALPATERRPEVESAFVALDERRSSFQGVLPPQVEIGGKRRRLADADPFAHGSFEVFDLERGLRFVPFRALARVRFERVRLTAKIHLIRRDGREEQAWLPLFYRWSESKPEILQANSTAWLEVYGKTRVPVGLRDFVEVGDDGRTTALVSPVHVLPHEWRFEE